MGDNFGVRTMRRLRRLGEVTHLDEVLRHGKGW